MEHIKILNLFGTIISYFSIMIIVWGVVTSLYRFLLNEVSKADNKEKAYTRWEIRASLGSFILFGLEILIAADIIDTIARPEINEIIIPENFVIKGINQSIFKKDKIIYQSILNEKKITLKI